MDTYLLSHCNIIGKTRQAVGLLHGNWLRKTLKPASTIEIYFNPFPDGYLAVNENIIPPLPPNTLNTNHLLLQRGILLLALCPPSLTYSTSINQILYLTDSLPFS